MELELVSLSCRKILIPSVENHDQPRIVSRMGSDHPAERAKSAKMTAMFHTSLTGTIFIYQGQEIGLCNVPRDWAEEEYKDIETIQALDGERDFRWKQNGKKGKPEDIDVSDVMRDMRWTARDNGRTPMQVSRPPKGPDGRADHVVGLFRARWFLQGYTMDAGSRRLQRGLECCCTG
jgi:glycosidase